MVEKKKGIMFKKESKGQEDQLGKTNRIVEETTIRGDIESISDIRLDGILQGNLFVKGRVVVGRNAKILGNIECENADIEGEVEGTLRVRDLLHIKESAIVKGELIVGRLSVEPGGKIEVTCKMLGGEKEVLSQNEKKESKNTKKVVAVEGA